MIKIYKYMRYIINLVSKFNLVLNYQFYLSIINQVNFTYIINLVLKFNLVLNYQFYLSIFN